MPWPKTLVLVRHAESEGNVRTVEERAAYEMSTHAYPLTERGREQARLTGAWLQEEYGAFDIHYTSYYVRAQETMRIMVPDARVYEDARLAEANRGIYHTYAKEEIARLFPKELERKEREGLYHHRPIGGENWPDIELRGHSFLGTLNRDCGGKRVLIVVHGFWLMLFQKLIHHFPVAEAERRYREVETPNASVTTYEPDGDTSRLCLLRDRFVPWEGKL
jgi:broad specificity phosphatase PhoE